DRVHPRHSDALAAAVKAPAMKRTFNLIADHSSAVPEMGSEMGTMRVEQMRGAIVATVKHEVTCKPLYRHDLPPAQLARPRDAIPATWERRKWKSVRLRQRLLPSTIKRLSDGIRGATQNQQLIRTRPKNSRW